MLNLLRECLLKDANRKTLNTHQFPYLVLGGGFLGVARSGSGLLYHLPYLPVGSLGSGWSGSTQQTELGMLQVWGMLAHLFRPTVSVGDPGWPLHSGRAGR